MSSKNLGTEIICDICGKKEVINTGQTSPFSRASMQVNSSEFTFSTSLDFCRDCLPSSYFSDPPSKKPVDIAFKDRLLNLIKNRSL